MLSRFSEVLQNAADVLAPPASRLEDFEYHWRQIQHFYQSNNDLSRMVLEETRVPHHLQQMLQLLVEEGAQVSEAEAVGPCLERVMERRVPLVEALAHAGTRDAPGGMRAAALLACTTLLRRHPRPPLDHPAVYQPLQKLLILCSESAASPTEKEEVELLLSVCGLVRKDPPLANIFTTPFLEDKASLLSVPQDIARMIPIKRSPHTPKKNPLFEVELPIEPMRKVALVRQRSDICEKEGCCKTGGSETSCRSNKTIYDDNDKFLLIDLLLSYLQSADRHIVLRACEGIMIVCSLEEECIGNLVTSGPACETLLHTLAAAYRAIPAHIDPAHVDQLNITWGWVGQELGDKSASKLEGETELRTFFWWVDYVDTLVKECQPVIAAHLAATFRRVFLESAAEPSVTSRHHAALATAIVAKCLRVVDSTLLINEMSTWLVGEGDASEWGLLHALVDNCLTERAHLTLETLRFLETLIEKSPEQSVKRLVLCRLQSRAYYCPPQVDADAQSDERDRLNDISFERERLRNREAMNQASHEDRVSEQVTEMLAMTLSQGDAGSDASGHTTSTGHAVDNIHAIVNSFLLLVPRALLSDALHSDYQQYIEDAQRHYQAWLDLTAQCNWQLDLPYADNTASSTNSYDSRPEADHHSDKLNPIQNDEKTDQKSLEQTEILDNNNKMTAMDANRGTDKKDDSSHYVDPRSMGYKQLVNSSMGYQQLVNIHEDSTELEPNQPDGDSSNIISHDDKRSRRFSQQLVHRFKDLQDREDKDQFDPGPFMNALFTLIERMTQQPYHVNLQLTSLISKLAMMPHPLLHEYLLNTTLPTAKNTKTLYKVLKQMVQKMTIEILRIKNFHKIIEDTRVQLTSEDPSYDPKMENAQLFECLIVVEEFCKELAAIAAVKHAHMP